MANLKKQAESVRPVLTVDELNAIILVMDMYKANHKIEVYAELALMKLKKHNFNITMGITKPAYITKGRAPSVANMNSSELLDALNTTAMSNPELEIKDNNPVASSDMLKTDYHVPELYSDEQKQDAEFAAADHFILTGEHKDWKEFL